jgi:hypothetical protein
VCAFSFQIVANKKKYLQKVFASQEVKCNFPSERYSSSVWSPLHHLKSWWSVLVLCPSDGLWFRSEKTGENKEETKVKRQNKLTTIYSHLNFPPDFFPIRKIFICQTIYNLTTLAVFFGASRKILVRFLRPN